MIRSHVGPLVLFMLFLLVPDALSIVAPPSDDHSPWWLQSPAIWLYPVQTLACLAALIAWRRHYTFAPWRGLVVAVIMGIAGIAVWIAPGFLYRTFQMSVGWWQHLGIADRTDGFDPEVLKPHGAAAYWFVLSVRFLRLVVVVPLVEEIFWRGFLMRFLINPDGDFQDVPFGTHHNTSLIVVTALFVLAHAPVDYAAATIYGLLAYWLAVRTKSLAACVLMHAVANLLLGLYVVISGQWGYW
ncbi:MAG: CAAX prenyl protease-related protein [Planctomycetaceae bacterium]